LEIKEEEEVIWRHLGFVYFLCGEVLRNGLSTSAVASETLELEILE